MAVIELKNKTYKEIVEEYFRDRSTEIFPNSCMDHAHVIIQQIFTYATDYVYVFSHKLDKGLWGKQDIIDAVTNAISRGVKIEFAIQEHTVDANELSDVLDEYGIQLRTDVNKEDKENFIVADDRMLRYEERYEQVEALASANQKELSLVLKNYFETTVLGISA